MEVEISESVPFYDTDCGGVVSNIAYLRYVEKARMVLFSRLGMDASTMTETGIFPTVIRTEIDYRSPARLGDVIRITAHLTSVEKVRAICAYRLTVDAGAGRERTICEAVQTVALVQMPSGRPKRMPEAWGRLL